MQNRAARYFLNVGKYTPNAAVLDIVVWKPITYHCWKSVLASWYRFRCMSHNRLNMKIFVWANNVARSTCKYWNFKVCKMLKDYNLERFCNMNIPIQKHDIYASVLPKILDSFRQEQS